MRIPKNLKEALRLGCVVTDQAEQGIPERSRRARGKILLRLDAPIEEAMFGYRELVVPYVATYHFGKPRAARANEKF
jgi:hypothetical protein